MKKLILASLLILAGGAFIWVRFFGDQWLEGFNEERQTAAENFRQQGRLIGERTNQQGCLDKALKDVASCHSPLCSVDAGNFFKACVETSAPSASFCESVPAYQSKISEEEKNWARYGCWDINNASEGCRLLKRQQQAFCSNIN